MKHKPNIILITIDCWRGDHLGAAEQAKISTPNIDAVARQSHTFSDAHSCGGWTKIAMTSMFSSTHASMYGYSHGKINAERPMLAEQLSHNGYNTAGFTTNIVCGRKTGFERGFNTFLDVRPDDDKKLTLKSKKIFERAAAHPISGAVLAKVMPSAKPFYPSVKAGQLVDIGLDWIKDNTEQPYFLWLHFMDLHWPYQSSRREIDSPEFVQMWQDRLHWQKVRQTRGEHYPGEQRAARWKQLYAEETESLDDELGRFFNTLKQRDDWGNTALCITSDHGEEFYEHGTWAHSWNQLQHEGTHVPLTLRLPNQSAGSIVERSTSQLDIAPTLLDIAGLDIPEKMLGKNLLCETNDAPIYSEMFGHAQSHRYRLAIKHEGYHYLYDGDQNRCTLHALSDLAQKDIYAIDCPRSKRFDRLRLAHFTKGALDMLKDQIVIGEDEMSYDLDDDPAVIERLRALGYMD